MNEKSENTNDRLSIRLLGGLTIERNDQEVEGFASSKARALIAYLACNPGSHSRETLATMLWDDRSQERAMGNMRVLLTSIRKVLSPFVDISRFEISLRHDQDTWIDIDIIEQSLSEICSSSGRTGIFSSDDVSRLEDNLLLYRGGFLAGFNIPSAREFDDWVRIERDRLHRRIVQCVASVADYFVREGEDVKGMEWVSRLLKLDPLHERGHEHMVVLLARSDQKHAALSHYDHYCQALAREMSAEPSPRMVALYQRLFSSESASTAPVEWIGISRKTLPSKRSAQTRLPTQLTPLIGREKELGEILSRLCRPECRLLTLIGPGGVGKTRLALAVIQHFDDNGGASIFPDGVCFVSLENVLKSSLIATAIADALSISLTEGASSDVQVLSYLHRHRLLLVLDNIEHLPDGAEMLLSILGGAPNVKLLLTSREHIDLHGEWLFEVPGLAFPDEAAVNGAQAHQPLAQYPAVQLFCHEALALNPSFSLTEEGVSVIGICQRVEGLPLAIQLAAASTRIFPAAQMLKQIEQNLDVLQTTMRNVPDRHQSLRAVFDHSWTLLTPQEQDAFRQLSVFPGRFSPDAAEHVAGVTIPMIFSLINSSLIESMNVPMNVPTGEETRYKMHAVLLQYAREKLELDGKQLRDVHDRHCSYYTMMLDEFGDDFLSHELSSAGLSVMANDIENLRAAWQWAALHGRLQRMERALPAFGRYYLLHGPFQEGSDAIGLAIEELRGRRRRNTDPLVDRLFGKLLAVQAQLYNRQAAYQKAVDAALEAIQVGRKKSLSYTEIDGHLEAALAYRFLGDYANALVHAENALDLSRDREHLQREGDSLLTLGTIYLYRAQFELARQTLTNALERFRLLENRRYESRTLNVLGILYLYQGHYSEASSRYSQALQLYREIGDRQGEAQVLNNLAGVSHHTGDLAAARSQYVQALAIQQELGGMQGVGLSSGNLSLLAQHSGDFSGALTFGEAAERIAYDLGDRDSRAFALLCIGHAYAGLKEWDEAYRAYDRSLALRRDLGQSNQALEPQAGLVQVALAAGGHDTMINDVIIDVLDDVNEILGRLEGNDLLGIVDPFRIYWICYLALRSADDSRADGILERAYQLLRQRSELISGALQRHTYVNNWPERRAISREYLRHDGQR